MAVRAVAPDERAAPKTITEAADRGTTRELLVALRSRIAKTVADAKCPPRDLASLSRRLIEIAREIEALDVADEESGAHREATPDDNFDASAV